MNNFYFFSSALGRRFRTSFLSALGLILLLMNGWAMGQTSVQNFGTAATTPNSSTTGNTTTIPAPTVGTSYARGGGGGTAPVAVSTTSNPLGTTGAFLKATASSSASVTKASPIVGYTGGTEFYTSFKILLGDTNASNTATFGVWTYYIGNPNGNATGTFVDNNDVNSANTFTGLRFTYGTSGALTLTFNNNGTYNSTGLTTSSFAQGTIYTIEIFGNNKSTGTINYLYNGVSKSVAVQKFDLYINGTLVGDDLTKGGLAANTAINAMTFTGVNSASNAANIFVDDVMVYNTVPSIIGSSSYSSKQNGAWTDVNTWNYNGVAAIVPPTSTDNVVINTGHTVTTGAAVTRDANTATMVDGVLVASGGVYTNNGTTKVNGTFQIDLGGWATGADFVYGSSSTLVFNHGDNNVYGPIDANHKYWPPAGPTNVIVKANSPINLGVARTVAGTFESMATVTNPENITIGTNGTMKLSAGYGWAGTGSPVYGTSSLLQYNSAGSPGRGAEWTQSVGTVGTTAGLPQNVQISNNTTLNFPNGSGGIFKANGDLTIDAGSSLYQNYGGGTAGLIVGGNLALNGNLGLGTNDGGEITLAGNWTQAAAANFHPNGRRAIFNGIAAQTIQKTGGGTINFDKIEINKTNATNVSISNAAGNLTDININGTTGNVLALTGAGTGTIDLKGRVLSFNNEGGLIYVDAAKSLSTTVTTGATVNFNGSKVVANNGGVGSLLFPVNVTINLNTNGVLDFGKSASFISTVNGILNINSTTNCYVNINAPIYGTGSKLIYKSGGTYGRTAEWSATSGAGYPYEVQVTNNTTLNYPNTAGAAFTNNLGVVTNLTIDSGSSLYMDYGGGNNKSGSLTIGKDLVNNGSLSLGNALGGDLYLAGNWTSSSSFTPNNRAVIFNGNNNDQNINNPTTFDYLTVSKTGTGSVVLAANIIVNKDLILTSKNIILGNFNLTLPNNSSTISSNTNSYITTLSGTTGKFIRQNIDGTQDWIFPMGATAAGRYAPITFKNLSGTTEIGVRVSTTLSPAVADATKTLKTEWFATTTNNVTANIYAEWQGATEQGASMTVPATGDLGVAIGTAPYTIYDVNLVASNTTATGVNLSNTAANGIVIGNDDAISLSNNECTGAKEIIVDAAAITGTTKGATQSLAPTCGSNTATDVWYKFTTTDAGIYRIDVTGSSSFDSVLDLLSGSCNGTSINCVDASGSGSNETISASLSANTTYYYRVYPYSSPTTYTFTTSVTTIPTLIVDPTSLAFGDVPFNTDSANKTFTVKGSFLNPASGNISLTAPTGYQLSLDGSTAWSNTLSLPYATKTLAQTTIYVKLNPAAACTDYNGNIAVSGGGAASVNVVVTGKGIVQAPVANTVATGDITATTFLATWNTVPNATSYVIEVSTSPTFGSGGTGSISETFESVNVPATYPTAETEYTLDGGRKWKIYRGNNTGIVYSGKSLALSNSAQGYIISPSISGITTVELYAMRNGSGTSTSPLYVYKTVGTTTTQVLPTIDMNASNNGGYKKFTINVNESGPATIKILNGTTNVANIDNIVISYDQFVPDFVSPYQNFDVGNVTSYVVNQNLQPNTQYYYRVRAVVGSCQSPNSNVVPVLTNDDLVIWDGTAWSNVTGPTPNLKAKIIGAFVTGAAPQNDFTAKKLTIENGGSVLITAGHYIKVENELVNNLTSDKVVVEDGGNLLQGNDNTMPDNSGNIKVEKLFTFTYYEPNNRQQYNYVSSPVIGGNLKSIYPGNPATLYHNQATNTFFNSSGANITGRALAVKEPSAAAVSDQTVTAAFIGVPFNGVLNYPLAYTVNPGVSPGFNLVGNPYPSNIDLEILYEDNKDKIEATFWFWDNRGNTEFKQLGSSYTGDNYAKYNAVSDTGVGIGTKAPNSPAAPLREPNQFVKVATGFMVRAKSDADKKTLDFRNGIRTADNSGPGFFGKEGPKDRFWLTMETPSGMNFTNAVVYFANGKENFGPEDTKTFNSSDAIYTVVGDQKLAINGKGVFQSTDKVDLGLSHFVNGNYTISSGKKEGVFANGQHIYLKDRQTGIITNLTEGAYTFTANAGETTGRFEIMYQPETVLGTDGTAKEELKVYRDGQEYVISSPGRKITGVEVYDTSGKLMMKSTTAQTEVRLNGNTWTDGVYILKISRDGEVITKKVLK